jgi:hypothetical protein
MNQFSALFAFQMKVNAAAIAHVLVTGGTFVNDVLPNLSISHQSV